MASVRVRIEGRDLDDEELDRLTRQLRSELRDSTDVEDVGLVGAGPAPAGTKGAEALQLGNLAVSLLPAALPGVIAVLRSWAGRHRQQQQQGMRVMVRVGDRAVDLEYPVATMTREDLLKLIEVVTGAPLEGGPKAG